MRAVQHERGDRILRAAEARLVEREERETGLHADRNGADVVAPEYSSALTSKE
jgi:hypothetical protein